jgi:hypothetical protein
MSFMNATPHINDVPHNLHPATVDLQGTRYKLTGYTTAPTSQEQETASLLPTLQQEIDLLDSSAKWALTMARQLRERSKTLQPWPLPMARTKTHVARRPWSLKVLTRLDVSAQTMSFPAAQRIKARIEVNCRVYTVLSWQFLWFVRFMG